MVANKKRTAAPVGARVAGGPLTSHHAYFWVRSLRRRRHASASLLCRFRALWRGRAHDARR